MFFKPLDIKISNFKVNNVDHLGSISFGTTEKMGRNVSAKKNQGFGQQLSDHTFRTNNLHFVLEDDILDQFSAKIKK